MSNEREETLARLLNTMAGDEIKNYIWPGMSSHLIGGGKFGKVRMFQASRQQHFDITPHSHRYEFGCFVVRGSVHNCLWTTHRDGEPYMQSVLNYDKKTAMGLYDIENREVANWAYVSRTYATGDWYFMNSSEIHSIVFSNDAQVLFFEGPQLTNSSIILEPFVDGEVIPTCKVEPWMFQT